MKKVRIGVLGAYRGASMINYCKRADHAEVVATPRIAAIQPTDKPKFEPLEISPIRSSLL